MFKTTYSALPTTNPGYPATQASKRRFGKKLYIVAATAVAVVIVALALFVPQGAAVIPLEVNYTVGEKMVYTSTGQITTTFYTPTSANNTSNMTSSSVMTIEVKDFDGQYYTLNRTTMITSSFALKNNTALSLIQKISKQGYTLTITQGNIVASNETQNPFMTGMLNRSEVRVGDTWTVPINSVNSIGTYSGTMALTFQGFEDITVPAGTFHVFKVVSTCDATIQTNPRIYNNLTSITTLTTSQNATMYMELSTCRQIKSNIQMYLIQSSTRQSPTEANVTQPLYSYITTSNMELVQDILP